MSGSAEGANVVEWLGLAVAVGGFAAIAYQLRQQLEQLRLSTLQAKYAAIQQINLYLVDNPELLPIYVGGARYDLVQAMSIAERKSLARRELMMDHLEFQYLCALGTARDHAESLVAAQMSNPELAEHWRGSFRGHFDRRFAAAVDKSVHGIDHADGAKGRAQL